MVATPLPAKPFSITLSKSSVYTTARDTPQLWWRTSELLTTSSWDSGQEESPAAVPAWMGCLAEMGQIAGTGPLANFQQGHGNCEGRENLKITWLMSLFLLFDCSIFKALTFPRSPRSLVLLHSCAWVGESLPTRFKSTAVISHSEEIH